MAALMVMAGVRCRPEAKVADDTKSAATTSADINPVGTYALVSVDGNKVPALCSTKGTQ